MAGVYFVVSVVEVNQKLRPAGALQTLMLCYAMLCLFNGRNGWRPGPLGAYYLPTCAVRKRLGRREGSMRAPGGPGEAPAGLPGGCKMMKVHWFCVVFMFCMHLALRLTFLALGGADVL